MLGIVSGAIACAATVSAAAIPAAAPSPATVIVIAVEGDVDPALAAFIARALRESREYADPLIILEMDTFGGRSDAAYTIVDSLLNVTHGQTIAYVKTKAISAGALIALSCRKLVMKQGTTIGDCAPLLMTNEGPKMLGEKFQSPLRAKFRALANRNGYPETLSEAMVSDNMTIYELTFKDTVLFLDSTAYTELGAAEKKKILSKTTVVSRGQLLTMNDDEALELGFSEMSAGSIEEMLERMGVEEHDILRMEKNWSEEFVGFIGMIAPVLMLIGFAALYIETRTPGFGVPGIIGIICLALVFLSRYMVGLADYTELLIIVLGLVLLGIEVFVTPGFGLLGISGILLIALGMLLSFQDFIIPQPEFPWQMALFKRNVVTLLLSLCGSVVLVFLFFYYAFPVLGKFIPGPYLTASLSDAHIADAPSVGVGDEGEALKPLRPSGKAKIGAVSVDVISDGEFIESGTRIRVIEISGNRIVVEKSGRA
jgi:membrane-bound serine protease (ClpP class)